MEDLMTAEQAAERLHKTPEWVTKAAQRGHIPSRKVGRSRFFTESDLQEYIDRVREGKDPWARSAGSKARIAAGERKRGRRS